MNVYMVVVEMLHIEKRKPHGNFQFKRFSIRLLAVYAEDQQNWVFVICMKIPFCFFHSKLSLRVFCWFSLARLGKFNRVRYFFNQSIGRCVVIRKNPSQSG
jgi:hypothetical protein